MQNRPLCWQNNFHVREATHKKNRVFITCKFLVHALRLLLVLQSSYTVFRLSFCDQGRRLGYLWSFLWQWVWSIVHWLTGQLSGWLAGLLTDWLICWLSGCLAKLLTDWLTCWLACWLTDWLADLLVAWLTGRLAVWRLLATKKNGNYYILLGCVQYLLFLIRWQRKVHFWSPGRNCSILEWSTREGGMDVCDFNSNIQFRYNNFKYLFTVQYLSCLSPRVFFKKKFTCRNLYKDRNYTRKYTITCLSETMSCQSSVCILFCLLQLNFACFFSFCFYWNCLDSFFFYEI